MNFYFKKTFRLPSVILYSVFLTVLCFNGQKICAQKITDTLINKSNNYLIKKFYQTSTLELKEIYTDIIIQSSKKEKYRDTLLSGYFLKSSLYNDQRVIQYNDSIINLTENNSTKSYPAAAYINKGRFYFRKNNFQKSLDNYLTALNYSEKQKNEDYIYRAKYLIALTKKELGDKEEALKILKENVIFHDKPGHEYNYLMTLYGIATIYYETNQLTLAEEINDKALKKAILIKNDKLISYFQMNKAVINFMKGDLENVKPIILSQIPAIEKFKIFQNLAIAYLYLGKVENSYQNEELAIKYLKKADSVVTSVNGTDLKFREIYTLLIELYKEKNDANNQLLYVNKLIKLDSVLHSNEVYLNRNVIRNYDIPKLVSEREAIITQIRQKDQRKKTYIILLLSILLLLSGGFFYQLRKKRFYKQRFLEIINQPIPSEPTIAGTKNTQTTSSDALEIPEETVGNILTELEKFEKKQTYLKSDITLPFVAKEMDTNTKYLSKVVKHHKGKNFTHYINELRISYAIDRLKTDTGFRKYTLLAIANDIGFKKTESFSKAFKQVTEITPAYFIRELDKK